MDVTVTQESKHWLIQRGDLQWRSYSKRYAETMAAELRQLPDDYPLVGQNGGWDLLYEEEDGYGRGW